MEEDKIRKIFDDFQPELSSSLQFMSKLQKNMEAVEIVRNHYAGVKRRNRIAVAIAAVCGFAMGVILTLLFPMITDWIASLNLAAPQLRIPGLDIDFSIITTAISWIIIAGASILTALSTYELALAKNIPSRK